MVWPSVSCQDNWQKDLLFQTRRGRETTCFLCVRGMRFFFFFASFFFGSSSFEIIAVAKFSSMLMSQLTLKRRSQIVVCEVGPFFVLCEQKKIEKEKRFLNLGYFKNKQTNTIQSDKPCCRLDVDFKERDRKFVVRNATTVRTIIIVLFCFCFVLFFPPVTEMVECVPSNISQLTRRHHGFKISFQCDLSLFVRVRVCRAEGDCGFSVKVCAN